MKGHLTIGAFSRVCRLSIKALRHYDQLGLLKPSAVDPHSGYRYYQLDQVAEAERMQQLRAIGMPLDEIGALLARPAAEAQVQALRVHQNRLENQLAELTQRLDRVRALVGDAPGPAISIQVKEVPALTVCSIRARPAAEAVGKTVSTAIAELMGFIYAQNAQLGGPPLALYHESSGEDDALELEIGFPIAVPLEPSGRIGVRELAAERVASAIHAGPYDTLSATNQALLAEIATLGLEPVGIQREVYLVTPGHTRNPADYQTELQWPVR